MHHLNLAEQCGTEVYKVESWIEPIVINRSAVLKEQLTSLSEIHKLGELISSGGNTSCVQSSRVSFNYLSLHVGCV